MSRAMTSVSAGVAAQVAVALRQAASTEVLRTCLIDFFMGKVLWWMESGCDIASVLVAGKRVSPSGSRTW